MIKTIKKYFSGSLKAVVLASVLGLSVNITLGADNPRDFINRNNYLPGGKYRLFGNGRGAVTDLRGNVLSQGTIAYTAGPIHTTITSFDGKIEYNQRFSNHEYWEHSPFSSSASRSFDSKKGSPAAGGQTVTNFNIQASEVHPADGYDGEQGGGYPTPTGARDEYTYIVSGSVRTIKVVNPDKPQPPKSDNKPNNPYNNGSDSGNNGQAENGSNDNNSRENKTRLDNANNSPDLANNNSGEVPLPYNYYPNGLTEADILALRLSPPPPFTEYDDGTKNNTNTANNYPQDNSADWQPEKWDNPIDLNATELAVGLGGIATDILTSIKGRSDSSVDSSIKLALTGDQKAIDNLEAASIISAEQANALRKAAVGRVQSRINITNDGIKHISERHFNPTKNASQFSISQNELRSLLNDKRIVNSPVTQKNGNYVREIDIGKNIGKDIHANNSPTSTLTVITDSQGNLLSAFPGVLK